MGLTVNALHPLFAAEIIEQVEDAMTCHTGCVVRDPTRNDVTDLAPDGNIFAPALANIGRIVRLRDPHTIHLSHQWRGGDLLMCDNHCTPHRDKPFDRATYKRDCRRMTINECGEEMTGFAHLQAA